MEENPLHQLIDQYLQGTISAADKETLQAKINTDPAVAKLVEEHQLAYRAIEAHRRSQLKTTLKTLDKTATGLGKKVPLWLTILLLLLGAGAIYLVISNVCYSPDSIARNHFIAFAETGNRTDIPEALKVQWAQAEQAFHEGSFRDAIQFYAIIAEDESSPVAEAARWNILMAQFALEGISPYFLLSLDQFESSGHGEVLKRARALKACLESGAFRFFSRGLYQNFSSIKPRLI